MQELSKEWLEELMQCADITTAEYAQLIAWVKDEPNVVKFAPDEICRMDPRNNRMTIYNAARSKRPHDNRSDSPPTQAASAKPCPICEGNTTRPVDVAPLKKGFTFINKNMFPCFFNPGNAAGTAVAPSDSLSVDAGTPTGNHFLQWTSSIHSDDWFNMGVDDLIVVLKRLGVFERHLLTSSAGQMPSSADWYGRQDVFGFVLMMKNYGAQVGGSLVHGHQQVTHSNVMSKSAYENWAFQKRHGMSFSKHLQQATPDTLRLKDFGAAELVVPYFMRRPMGTMLLLKDDTKSLISDLGEMELLAIVDGVSQTVRAYHILLPAMGRDIAYNVLFHTGPGAGIYVELLPHTQETGGMEQLGLWVCQDTPDGSAGVLREYIGS